jgi:hypothetical protein
VSGTLSGMERTLRAVRFEVHAEREYLALLTSPAASRTLSGVIRLLCSAHGELSGWDRERWVAYRMSLAELVSPYFCIQVIDAFGGHAREPQLVSDYHAWRNRLRTHQYPHVGKEPRDGEVDVAVKTAA